MPRFDLCLSPKDVDDDIVQIDTILEALEPGYPPPEIDERRRSRADVKYYESASTTEGSDDTERKERKRLKKNEYSRIYRARKMKKLKTLSANQPLASTHKKSQSLVCPHCGFIGKRAAGFAHAAADTGTSRRRRPRPTRRRRNNTNDEKNNKNKKKHEHDMLTQLTFLRTQLTFLRTLGDSQATKLRSRCLLSSCRPNAE